MLELRSVSKCFSSITAVDNVSFSARAGEVTGYLGPNGSGKSTTMKMITGLIEMTSGEILFDGRRIQDDLIGYKQRMGYVPEGASPLRASLRPGVFGDGGPVARPPPEAHGGPHRRPAAPFRTPRRPARSDLRLFQGHAAEKILLSAALLHNPNLLLLDEPFSGLDVGSALVLRSLIQELAARGKVVLFSSHELETVERGICSHVVILHRGKIVADDSIERLRTLMELPTLEDIFSQ